MAYQPKSYRKFVATAATATLVASAVAPAAAAGFTDVSDRYSEAVNYLVENDITSGFTETTFGVSKEVKRGDAAVMIAKALGLDGSKSPDAGFSDVPARAKEAVNALKEAGIFNGKSATNFGFNDTMTRGEMALVIAKAYKLEGDVTLKFTDVSDRYESAVKALVENKITTGKTETSFGTGDNITRGEFAIFLYRAEVLDEAPGVVEVTGVSAINGSQLVVTFSQEVDTTSAEEESNYTLSDGNVVTSADLQEDGKSVKLTLTTPYTSASSIAVTVKNIALKSDTTTKFPLFTSVVKVDDTTKAEVASVSSITNGSTATTATVNFSEPVKSGIIKVNGQSVGTITSTVESFDLTGLNLDASKSHKIEVVNLTDTAGNVNSLAILTFNVVKDANAPLVSSVSAYGDYKILVTFNKKINATTVASTDVAVKDELLNPVSVSDFSPLTGDTTGTKFVITLDPAQPEVSGLYTNKTTRDLTVVFGDKSVDDTLGNQLSAVTKSVSLSKDVVAPTVKGLTYKKDSTSKEITEITVIFDEDITNSLDLSKFTVVDSNGVLKNSILSGASVSVTGNKAVIDITDAVHTGVYNFQIANGATTDLALKPNNSNAFAGAVDFGTNETSGTFNFVDGDGDSTNGEVTEAANVITVTYPEAVKGGAVAGSATDLNNYSINSKPLPTGTTITLDSTQKVATITLGKEIVTSDANAVFTINNVVSLSGKTIKPVTTTTTITDNVAPVLQSARVLDNDTIELTYSENLNAVTGALVGAEFAIYEGSTAKALADADLTATSVSGYNNKVVIDLASSTLDLTKEISVESLNDATPVNNDIKDSALNVQKAKIKVTATK